MEIDILRNTKHVNTQNVGHAPKTTRNVLLKTNQKRMPYDMTIIVKKTLSLSGLFYRRRDDWIRHVIKLPKDQLSIAERLVAVYIAETTNPKAQSWVVSQKRMALDLGVDPKVAKNAVMKLRRMGLIEVRRVRVNGQTKLFNSYAIVAVEHAEPL